MSDNKNIKKDMDFVITLDDKGINEVLKDTGEIERYFTADISSPDVDRVKDRVLPGAFMNLSKDGSRIPILWAHNKDELPIGKTVWVKNDHTKQRPVMKAIFANTAKAIEAYELIKGGFISNVSVGMNIIDYKRNDMGGLDISKAELLEVSLVNIPANRDAIITGIKGFISKGFQFTESTMKEFDIDIVGVISGDTVIDIIDEIAEPIQHKSTVDIIAEIKTLVKELEENMLTNSPDENVEESDPATATSDDQIEIVEESGEDAATSDSDDSDEDTIEIEGD